MCMLAYSLSFSPLRDSFNSLFPFEICIDGDSLSHSWGSAEQMLPCPLRATCAWEVATRAPLVAALEEWTGCAPGSPSTPFRFRCHLTLASPHPEQGFARKQSAGAWFQPRSKLFSTDLASFLQTSFLPCVFVSFLSAPTWPWYHGLQSQTKQHTGGLHNQHVVEEAVTALNTQRLCCKDINISFVLNNGNKVTRFQSKETCQE